jgi:acyl-coenzyme A synthetase/AMP-(fatty) acid ligase
MKKWFERILFQTYAQPETPAIVMEDRVITYAMLRGGIERCARRLDDLDLSQQGPVAVIVSNPLRHMVLCYALHRIGIPSISLERGQSGIEGLSFQAILDDSGGTVWVPSWGRRINVTDEWFTEDLDGNKELPPGFPDSGALCRVSLTSGSTGVPKIVNHSVAAIGRRVFEKTVGKIDASRRAVLCLPGLSANFGYTTCCATLAAGRTLCFAESFAQAIRMIELFSIDFVMASTEQLLYLTRTARGSGAQLRSLRVIWTGGSSVTKVVLEAAMVHLCRDIYSRYSGTEAGEVAYASAREMIENPGLVGLVLPETEIAIVDSGGHRCPPRQIGIIKVRQDMEPTDTNDVPDAANGWITLGDMGWIDQERRLYVVGRVSDDGVLGADHSRALEVEHLLQLGWGASDVGAVFVADAAAPSKSRIWVGIVNRGEGSQEKLEAMLRARGIDCAVSIFDVGMIPRGVNGKVNRIQLRAMLSDLSKQN